MRLAYLVLINVLFFSEAAVGQVACSPISSEISIGKLAARSVQEFFVTSVSISCRNIGVVRDEALVVVRIPDESEDINNGDQGRAGPFGVQLQGLNGMPVSRVCRQVRLGGNEAIIINFPVQIVRRFGSYQHGTHRKVVRFTVETIDRGLERFGLCESG